MGKTFNWQRNKVIIYFDILMGVRVLYAPIISSLANEECRNLLHFNVLMCHISALSRGENHEAVGSSEYWLVSLIIWACWLPLNVWKYFLDVGTTHLFTRFIFKVVNKWKNKYIVNCKVVIEKKILCPEEKCSKHENLCLSALNARPNISVSYESVKIMKENLLERIFGAYLTNWCPEFRNHWR